MSRDAGAEGRAGRFSDSGCRCRGAGSRCRGLGRRCRHGKGQIGEALDVHRNGRSRSHARTEAPASRVDVSEQLEARKGCPQAKTTYHCPSSNV